MRRIAIWLAATTTIVVLLFGYHTSTNSTGSTVASGRITAPVPLPTATSAPKSTAPGSSRSRTSHPKSAAPKRTPTTGASSSTTAAKTYTGSVAQTQWGPVEVRVTVAGGKITDVALPQYPNGNSRDQEINAYALPTLVQETLKAQSANVDMVSGATVTSDGYLQSLQSALDQAGL